MTRSWSTSVSLGDQSDIFKLAEKCILKHRLTGLLDGGRIGSFDLESREKTHEQNVNDEHTSSM